MSHKVCSRYNRAAFIRQEPDLPPAAGAEGQEDSRCAELRGWASFPTIPANALPLTHCLFQVHQVAAKILLILHI